MKRFQSSRKRLFIVLFCVLAAAVPLMICSKSSPLYPFNDWPDVNMFLTLGRGMLKGRVPFVDLLEQKGPYTYLVGGMAWLISHRGFQGYFLFELVSLFFFAYYSWQTIGLYTKKPALWVLPLLCAGITSAKSFVHGGSLEELSLGIFAYGIYSLLVFLKEEDGSPMPVKTLVWNGIWAGILFWTKFTLTGLYVVWLAAVALRLIAGKKWGELLRSVGIFLGAMLVTTIPWLIYFGWHGAIEDWFRAYLWDNIFGYARWEDSSVMGRIWTAVGNMVSSLKDRGNRAYSFLVAAGALTCVCCPSGTPSLKFLYKFSRILFRVCKFRNGGVVDYAEYSRHVQSGKKTGTFAQGFSGRSTMIITWKEKAALAFMGLAMGIGIFIGETKHDYYGLPLSVFSMFGGLGLVMLWGWLWEPVRRWLRKAAEPVYTVFFLIVLLICSWGSFRRSPNTYLLSVEKEQMPQFRFARIIQESSDQTVLNYGFLDGGFYTVLDQVPEERVFCVLNRNPDQMLAEQNQYVREGRTHFLVAWKAYTAAEEELRELPVVSERYELVDFLYFTFEGDTRTYALYERRD